MPAEFLLQIAAALKLPRNERFKDHATCVVLDVPAMHGACLWMTSSNGHGTYSAGVYVPSSVQESMGDRMAGCGFTDKRTPDAVAKYLRDKLFTTDVDDKVVAEIERRKQVLSVFHTRKDRVIHMIEFDYEQRVATDSPREHVTRRYIPSSVESKDRDAEITFDGIEFKLPWYGRISVATHATETIGEQIALLKRAITMLKEVDKRMKGQQ